MTCLVKLAYAKILVRTVFDPGYGRRSLKRAVFPFRCPAKLRLLRAEQLTGMLGNAVSSLVQSTAVLVNAMRSTSNDAKRRLKLRLVYSL